MLVHETEVPGPLFASVATEPSTAQPLAGEPSKPLLSPPVSAAWVVQPVNAVTSLESVALASPERTLRHASWRDRRT